MAPRPYWKGYLKLSLVACPVSVFTATTSSERVSFRQINRKTGNRLRQQLVDDETREPVDAADKVRGYEVDKGVYVQVEDDEIEALEIESNHTIDIDSFVPRAQIDERYLDSSYYIAPNDQVGREAFAVIREAMRGKDMVALGRIVLAKRERVIALQPWENGLLGTTLRYAYEVRTPASTSTKFRPPKFRRTCCSSPSISWTARPAISIPRASSTTTKRRWLRCSNTNRPARRCRSRRPPRPRRTSST
jgi:DNA end-binding protein Ku